MDNPDSVRRVTPPNTIMAKINAQQLNNQSAGQREPGSEDSYAGTVYKRTRLMANFHHTTPGPCGTVSYY